VVTVLSTVVVTVVTPVVEMLEVAEDDTVVVAVDVCVVVKDVRTHSWKSPYTNWFMASFRYVATFSQFSVRATRYPSIEQYTPAA
jgi:hypothetical protein